MVANQYVLLPLWLSAAPPAHDRSVTVQPPAYSHDGGGMCKVLSVAGFKTFDSPCSPARWMRGKLRPVRNRAMDCAGRAQRWRVIVLGGLHITPVEPMSPGLNDGARSPRCAETRRRHFSGSNSRDCINVSHDSPVTRSAIRPASA